MRKLALLILFVPLLSISAAHAVFGGETIGASHPAAASLVAVSNAHSAVCTGTFVAKNLVLTAAHCVQAEDPIGAVGDFVYPLSLPEGYDPLRGARLRVVEVSLPPASPILIDVAQESFSFDNPDFALLRLSESYEPAVPAIPSGAFTGEASFAGFGQGIRHWQRPDEIKVRLFNEAYGPLGEEFADLSEGNTFLFMRAVAANYPQLAQFLSFALPSTPGSQALCYGDSGGPLFTFANHKVYLHGVASLYMPHPNKGSPLCGDSYLAVFAKVGPAEAWLDSEIARLSDK